MDAAVFSAVLPMLVKGFYITMEIAIIGILLGFVLGAASGYALQSGNRAAQAVAGVYVWIIRGTPIVVQALYVYFVVPAIISLVQGEQYVLDSTIAGIIVITVNAGAFISAIVKGALESVDVGQIEAGYALGLTKRQVLFHVIIPPAFKVMLPALFNQFIISVKDTAMLSIISVNEITRQTQNYVARTYNTIPAYTMCAVFYLVLLSALMILQHVVEQRLKK